MPVRDVRRVWMRRADQAWLGRAWGVLLTCVLSTSADAVDWDGNFPVDGSFDGEYVDPLNWVGNAQPPPNFAVEFGVNAAYTVTLNDVNIPAGGVEITDGDVAFKSDFGYGTNWLPEGIRADGNNTRATLSEFDFALQSPGGFLTAQAGAEMLLTKMTGDMLGINLGNSLGSGFVTLSGGEFDVGDGSGPANGNLFVSGTSTTDPSRLLLTDGTQVDAESVFVGTGVNATGSLHLEAGSEAIIGDGADSRITIGSSGDGVLEVFGIGTRLTALAGTPIELANNAFVPGTSLVTIEGSANATFDDAVDAGAGSTLHNANGTLEVGGFFTNDGVFRQSGPTASVSTFNGDVSFFSGAMHEQNGGRVRYRGRTIFDPNAALNHTGGEISFEGQTTLAQVALGFDDPDAGETATWTVRDLVEFTRRLRVGENASTTGALSVGADGVLRNTEAGTASDLAVGFNGTGTLEVLSGAVVDIYDDVIFGQNPGSDGSGTVAQGGELVVNRNGTGSNLFVGFNGSGVLNVRNGGEVRVGNDLVVQAAQDTVGAGSVFTAGTANSTGTDLVTVGNDLLIGTTTPGGTLGTAFVRDGGDVQVANLTRVRASGQLQFDGGGRLSTTHLTTDPGAVLAMLDGLLELDGGVGTINHGAMLVGIPGVSGVAAFTVINGATATLGDGLTVGQGGGSGEVRVEDANSRLTLSNPASVTAVGNDGVGVLIVRDTAEADLGGVLNVGADASGNGNLQIAGALGGARSTVRINGAGAASQVNIGGGFAVGQIDVRDGGYLETAGVITIGDTTSGNTNVQSLLIGGIGDGIVSEVFARQIRVVGDQSTLRPEFSAVVNATDSITFESGANWNQLGGILTTPTINLADGTADTNIAGGTVRTGQINGDFTNDAGTLAPDSGLATGSRLDSLNVTGELTQGAGATLAIEIGGVTPGTGFDRIVADEVTLLAGTTLDVELVNNFMPMVGNTYEIVLASGVFGTFTNTTGLNLGNGLAFDVLYGPDRVTLEVVLNMINGDYNDSGLVEQGDLNLVLNNWGAAFGTIGSAWINQRPTEGIVDQAELNAVLNNWGANASPDFSGFAVPEPGAALALLTFVAGRRRHRYIEG